MTVRVGRSKLLCGSACLLLARDAAWPQPCHAAVRFSSGAEELRKVKALRPGFGPQDLDFPSVFRGRWTVQSQVVAVKTPLGDAAAPAGQLQAARELLAAEGPQAFEARWLDPGGGGGLLLNNNKEDGVALTTRAYSGTVISDRGFNAERRAAGLPGAAELTSCAAEWDVDRPNALTLSCREAVVESKVVTRSSERPYDGAFGTSEVYALVRGTESSAALRLNGARVQTKYKWDATPAPGDAAGGEAHEAGGQPGRIEALELVQLFPPTEEGRDASSTPLLTVKSRLVFERKGAS